MDFTGNLRTQLQNYDLPTLNFYWRDLFTEIDARFLAQGKYLEVGAGAGASKKFLTRFDILQTDLLEFSETEVLGGVNLMNLRFQPQLFSGVFGVDVIHHIADPLKALVELKKVLKLESNSKIIFIEPYVSITSYLIYKIFHHEYTSFPYPVPDDLRIVSVKPEDADQTIARWLFSSKKHKNNLFHVFPTTEYSVEIKYKSIISFFITGGLQKPLPTPLWVMKSVLFFEKFIPQWFLKYTASRMIAVITKN